MFLYTMYSTIFYSDFTAAVYKKSAIHIINERHKWTTALRTMRKWIEHKVADGDDSGLLALFRINVNTNPDNRMNQIKLR